MRIVTEQVTGVPSVTVGIWVENGSRFEERPQGGISHFLEHLLFKGTDRRTAAQIAAWAGLGQGMLNIVLHGVSAPTAGPLVPK